ncbi:DNA glycosylase [Aspergillus pseudoustus]|uniref:DNA glycosylase n=1 Tax=Aspergillus pseudoustus TaxID=1810923 RepID=A0ABR4KL91_9EURO
MALRRSARLSAVLPLKSTIQPPLTPTNGVTKARKTSTKEKKKQTQKKKVVLNSLPQPSLTSDADLLSTTPTLNPTSTSPATAAADAISKNNSAYWDDHSASSNAKSKRPQTPPPLDRPVEPHRTNAPLLTPHGSSIVAYPPGAENISPSKTGLPRPTATTGTLLEQATAHLIATDRRLEPLIKAHRCALFSPEGLAERIDPFQSLVSTIIGQQVSGAAARSIKEKFVALLYGLNHANGHRAGGALAGEWDEDYFPTPEEIGRCDIATLRTAGLSQRKAEYIHGLAEKFASGELSARTLLNASDEELLEKLTAVRGLGRWSVEMFACFTLKRIDVFSTGDLGVQRGCAAFLGRDVGKLKAKNGKFKYMSEQDMLELAAKFAPYRSLFMWYMWRVVDVDIAVMTD